MSGVPTDSGDNEKPDESFDGQLALVIGLLISVSSLTAFVANPNLIKFIWPFCSCISVCTVRINFLMRPNSDFVVAFHIKSEFRQGDGCRLQSVQVGLDHRSLSARFVATIIGPRTKSGATVQRRF